MAANETIASLSLLMIEVIQNNTEYEIKVKDEKYVLTNTGTDLNKTFDTMTELVAYMDEL